MPVPSPTVPVTTDIDGVAEILGVSRRTVLRYVHRRVNPLPSAKLAPGKRGTVIFIVEDVVTWLRGLQRRPPVRRLKTSTSKARTSQRPSQRR